MAKPKKIPFTEALESVLVNIWGGTKDYLDDALIRKTRKALVEIRGIYLFKGDFPGKYPSTIQYRLAKNRAGYLAAFGQRHAYLTYSHLKAVENKNPEVIPRPEDRKGELVVTTLGAGAAIETYGICYFFNEETQRVTKLHLNLVEKVSAWIPNRHIVFSRVLKGTFPKLDVTPTDIDVDLTKDCIPKFADHFNSLVKTDILLIYNVMNEIPTKHSLMVWRNINFILRNCARPLLILLMEPCVSKARPRVDWLRAQLAQSSEVINDKIEEEIFFNSDPIKIGFEDTNIGLNDRLFGQKALDGSKPVLQRSLKRTHMACMVKPQSPISMEQVQKQLAMLNIRRGKRGRFIRQPRPQGTFWDKYPNWDKSN
jgi:hypothetical protein